VLPVCPYVQGHRRGPRGLPGPGARAGAVGVRPRGRAGDGDVTNLEPRPEEEVCAAGPPVPEVELIPPREVPLGGPRAMTVRRTLPSRGRSLIGAFCFADHYGPDDIAESGGMDVAPHPHTGLQT